MAHRAPSQGLQLSPRIRQTAYFAGTVLLAVLGAVQIWTGISDDAVSTIAAYVNGILTLIGATAPAYAGAKVESQIRTGVLE